VATVRSGPIASAVASLLPPDGGRSADAAWVGAWAAADAAASRAIDRVLDARSEPTEPAVARTLTRRCAAVGADLVVSSSMPIRDVEWFGDLSGSTRAFSNRGANGIDGVVSTAVGVAVANRPDGRRTALLVGDIAFLHDSNGLLGAAGRDIDLVVVVVDNDGGGIFSFLPQRSALEEERFEHLFGTPHSVDLAGLAAAHGVPVAEAMSAAEVRPAIDRAFADGGLWVVLVRTDRDANVAVHGELDSAVAGEPI
jgi:2-succinyl-5-enolpyruvyl-6-hydroxy-3-cyclohexene-1-carboxylate synthase